MMEGGGLYPHIEIEPDIAMEDKFYDFDPVQSDKEQLTTCCNSEANPQVNEEAFSLPRSLNQTSKHVGKVLGQSLAPKEIVDNSQSVSSVDTKTDRETCMDTDVARKDFITARNANLCEQKETGSQIDQNSGQKYFYYDLPLLEETGPWIPVSVPPMSASDHEEWNRGLCVAGGYFPEEDFGWQHEDQELTMWTVVSEMLAVIPRKVGSSFAGAKPSVPNRLMARGSLEHAWKEMAETLSDTTFSTAMDILDAEPTKWIADSAASACMLCNSRFHPIMCPRHHCRFCGGIFCGVCSRGRSLLPERFRTSEPQRVCDVCWVRLESVQGLLIKKVSRAAQPATHDVTDLSTLRSWLNFPWGQSMEYEIYKATNTLRSFVKVGSLRPERSIPDAVLRRAKGLCILTVVKVGMMVTYKAGTGLVIARKEDGSWSSPSAVSSFGVGWGAQAGGELTDFIIVLRTDEAVKTFSGNIHFSIGAGLSAAAGPVGRAVEADIRAGDGGSAACYTYSCSKGAFVGCSLEGNMVTTRNSTNAGFYGNASIKASDILLGPLPRPQAAVPLYNALSELFEKFTRYKALQ